MTSERIREIQEQTAYPESRSVHQALLQVWNECEQENNKQNSELLQSNKELLEALEYWKKRCKLIETCENESPCDPDITSEQIEAWKNYHNFIKEFGNRN